MDIDSLSLVNSIRKMPIVFYLNVSRSMNVKTRSGHYTRMDLLNFVLNALMHKVKAPIERKQSLSSIICYSISLMGKYLSHLFDVEIPCYPPLLLVISNNSIETSDDKSNDMFLELNQRYGQYIPYILPAFISVGESESFHSFRDISERFQCEPILINHSMIQHNDCIFKIVFRNIYRNIREIAFGGHQMGFDPKSCFLSLQNEVLRDVNNSTN